MLATCTNTSGIATSYDDIVNEARKWRDAADDESDNGAPVGGEFGRVAVDAVEVVHIGYGDIATSDDEVAVNARASGQWI